MKQRSHHPHRHRRRTRATVRPEAEPLDESLSPHRSGALSPPGFLFGLLVCGITVGLGGHMAWQLWFASTTASALQISTSLLALVGIMYGIPRVLSGLSREWVQLALGGLGATGVVALYYWTYGSFLLAEVFIWTFLLSGAWLAFKMVRLFDFRSALTRRPDKAVRAAQGAYFEDWQQITPGVWQGSRPLPGAVESLVVTAVDWHEIRVSVPLPELGGFTWSVTADQVVVQAGYPTQAAVTALSESGTTGIALHTAIDRVRALHTGRGKTAIQMRHLGIHLTSNSELGVEALAGACSLAEALFATLTTPWLTLAAEYRLTVSRAGGLTLTGKDGETSVEISQRAGGEQGVQTIFIAGMKAERLNGLRIRHRQPDLDAHIPGIGDLILDRMLCIVSEAPASHHEMLAHPDVRGLLLEVIAGHPESSVDNQTLTMVVPGYLRAELRERFTLVCELTRALARR